MNSFSKMLAIALFVGGACPSAFGTPLPACGAASLAAYITITSNPPASGGCATGGLDYFNFSYHPVQNAPLASGINVTPTFSFGPATAAPGQVVNFEIDYLILLDAQLFIRSDSLSLDATGNVIATEYFCNDTQYIGNGLCLGSHPAQSLTVGTPVTGLSPSASMTFAQPVTTSQNVGVVLLYRAGRPVLL
jgi:hypothetical protein